MREEFALRIDELGHGVSVHSAAKRHDMQLVQRIDVLEECSCVGADASMIPERLYIYTIIRKKSINLSIF